LARTVTVQVVEGDLLDQQVDAIVNAWNRNTIPWWLLLPQGVSGAFKRRGGLEPYWEVGRHGRLALGQAVATSAGRLPQKGIIHEAGINDFWRAGERSIRYPVRNVSDCRREGLANCGLPRSRRRLGRLRYGEGSGDYEGRASKVGRGIPGGHRPISAQLVPHGKPFGEPPTPFRLGVGHRARGIVAKQIESDREIHLLTHRHRGEVADSWSGFGGQENHFLRFALADDLDLA
jgi:hypothetical protein